MKQSKLEKKALKVAGDVCACLYEHGYEKCKNRDLSFYQLAEWLRDLSLHETENPEQQINVHIKSIAINFCMKSYNSVESHINHLNKLGISSKLIKNSELYRLATECVVQDFNQEINDKHYENALNVIDIAKNIGVKIPEITEKQFASLDSMLDSAY